MTLRWAALPLLLLSCSNSAGPAHEALKEPPSASLPAPSVLKAVAEQTALLTLLLHQDGTASLTSVTRKPIPYRGRQLLPFEAARHSPSRFTAPALARPQPTRVSHVLVVRAPSLKVPLVVPLELGSPHEGGGDVVDRWAEQTLIIRAPSFGEGTQYALVQPGDEPALLAERTESR